jgi:plasmid stabilization system protein ParE
VARSEAAPGLIEDFDRIFDHLAQYDPAQAPGRIAAIVDALQLLVSSPLIGRPVRGGLRELVIGRGSRGYVALYRYLAEIDTVFVLAICSQREAGYARSE